MQPHVKTHSDPLFCCFHVTLYVFTRLEITMTHLRNCFYALLIAATTMLAGTAQAQFKAGQDYTLYQPPRPIGSDKIEAIEFFAYTCGVCYRVDAIWHQWEKKQASDVVVKQVPTTGREWGDMAVMYYTLESMGRIKELHPKIFEAIHKEGIPLPNASKRAEWLKAQGINLEEYERTAKSFSVLSKLRLAEQLTIGYAVERTPTFVFDGRYKAALLQGKPYESSLPLFDHLVSLSRSKRQAK
jgi:protein dithiol oxidoreductase (disulfide-forming)